MEKEKIVSSLDGRFVIMLDHHLEHPLYEDQWPIIYHDETLGEARVHKSYYKVNRTEPRVDYAWKKIERKNLVYLRPKTGETKTKSGWIYKFRSSA